ncbi:hypothetical protein [Croceibacterium aestuarii]|uniref:hypothetical protein n=1 Tax=Croceibacterium aestuarii TaxID=3064139 RepID=UPI00272E86AD|nr:hypothetical protein [Croceibacterium sp. D39]
MSQANKHGFPLRRMTTTTADVMMASWIAIGAAILLHSGFRAETTIVPSANPWFEWTAIALGAALLAWLLASRSRLDRRCSEDYLYQLLATGAMVGMFTMLLASVPWALDFIRDAVGLRDLRGNDMLAIGLLGWGVGYFTFRIRGLK